MFGFVSDVFGPGVSVSVCAFVRLVRDVDASHELVLEHPRVELEQGLALIGEDRLVLVAAGAVAGDDDRRRGLPGGERLQDAARRDLRQAVRVLVAEDVVDRDVLVELVVERERGAVQVDLLLVLLDEPVVVRLGPRRAARRSGRGT